MRLAATLVIPLLFTARLQPVHAEAPSIPFKDPPHSYLDHAPKDRFTKIYERLLTGKEEVDTSSDRAFLISLLKALDIPVSSQILVFSATSLQSEMINPRNPRALYFNEDTYLGWVPGGRVEVIGIDPEFGPIFYVFDRLRSGSLPRVDRSLKCFNCHAGTATQHLPGLIAESVLVSMAGSSLETYRHDVQGHQIPLEDRFGGWILTGNHNLRSNHANTAGRSQGGRLEKFDASPGRFYDPSIHLLPTSDILPQMIHEHQLGFENRVFQAHYLVRQRLHEGKGRLTSEAQKEIEDKATEIARYTLFADEAQLPPQGIEGDPGFVKDFLRNKRPAASGLSLKDLDLRTHLFKHRCSYMLYTDSWKSLPQMFKDRVYYRMAEALRDANNPKEMAHLGMEEKRAIRQILKETMDDLPVWWR